MRIERKVLNMMISTRGRYALRVIIDLAEQNSEEYIPLKDIVERQNISQKYVEGIMTQLSKNNLVEAIHGKKGGYRLNKAPDEYTIGEILRVTEGSLAPVACLEDGAKPCERSEHCRTFPVWDKLNDMINNYLDSVTVADLMKTE